MKKLKEIIRNLPGPKSYCSCRTLCSAVTVEHVIPKHFIKKQGKGQIANDPHNLLPCCARLNCKKGAKLFARDFLLAKKELNGPLARICLFVAEKHNIRIDKETREKWQKLDSHHPPQDQEYKRHEIIRKLTKCDNFFILAHKPKDEI